MKRFIVLADSHGNTGAIDRVLLKAGNVDGVIHLGDYVRDAGYIRSRGLEVYSVKGNCDFNTKQETERLLNLGGRKIWITHGHNYGVKYSIQRLLYRAMELEADAVLFGHTHVSMNGYEQGILVLNPGSIAEPRCAKPTYAVLEAGGGDLKAELRLL